MSDTYLIARYKLLGYTGPVTQSATTPEAPLIFITGKGGVGKSTIAVEMARDAAARGEKTALVGLTPEAFAGLCGIDGNDYAGTHVDEHLTVFALNPRDAFEDFASGRLGSRRLYRTVFDNRFVHYFLDATPGLNELALLGKICQMATDDGFDRVIVDLPSTGHGCDFLEVPRVLTETVRSGPMKSLGQRMHTTLQDASQTSVVIVSLCEEMPVTEAEEIYTRITTNGMHCGRAVANRVRTNPVPDKDTWATLRQMHATDPAWAPYIEATQYVYQRWQMQDAQLQRLQTIFGEKLCHCKER